jgi:hypothetical protein
LTSPQTLCYSIVYYVPKAICPLFYKDSYFLTKLLIHCFTCPQLTFFKYFKMTRPFWSGSYYYIDTLAPILGYSYIDKMWKKRWWNIDKNMMAAYLLLVLSQVCWRPKWTRIHIMLRDLLTQKSGTKNRNWF